MKEEGEVKFITFIKASAIETAKLLPGVGQIVQVIDGVAAARSEETQNERIQNLEQNSNLLEISGVTFWLNNDLPKGQLEKISIELDQYKNYANQELFLEGNVDSVFITNNSILLNFTFPIDSEYFPDELPAHIEELNLYLEEYNLSIKSTSSY